MMIIMINPTRTFKRILRLPWVLPLSIFLSVGSIVFYLYLYGSQQINDLKVMSVHSVQQDTMQQLFVQLDIQSFNQHTNNIRGYRIQVREKNKLVFEKFALKTEGEQVVQLNVPGTHHNLCVFAQAVGESAGQLRDPSLKNNYFCMLRSL